MTLSYFRKSSKKRKSTFDDLLILMKQRVENRKTEKDADDLFFASYASEMKTFDIQTRALIKERIAGIFREARHIQQPINSYATGATLVQSATQPINSNVPNTPFHNQQYSACGYYGTIPSSQPAIPMHTGARNISQNIITLSDGGKTVDIPFQQM